MNAVFYYLSWPFKHLRVMFFLMVVGFIAYGVVQCNSANVTATPDYLENTPDTAYYIKTDSRIYYMNDYTDKDGIVTLHNYYEFNGKKWVFVQRNLSLVKAHFTKELIIREN